METDNDSIDLYTLWKRDEELHQHRIPIPPIIQKIPFKSDISKYLVPTFSQVFYTDGYSSMKEDKLYEKTLFDGEMEIPSIGTDKKNFDIAETITFDILGSSTRLPLMCKMIIYQQGATHEREPPILVRDISIQWDGFDRLNRNNLHSLTSERRTRNGCGLERARSSDYLLDDMTKSMFEGTVNSLERCSSMASSMTEADDMLPVMTLGSLKQHRMSHLLRRHRFQRHTDMYLFGHHEFYSVPFYQYRGRRYGQKHNATQVNEFDFQHILDHIKNSDPTRYSVTIILPVRDSNKRMDKYLNIARTFHAHVPVNRKSKHTTVGYMNTKQFITIQRTISGKMVDV